MLNPERDVVATPTSTSTFPCDQCRRTFNRPSHLNRHRLTHLPSSRRRVVSCSYCERSFSRQDVLLRHLRATHGVQAEARSSNQRSCDRCVRHKLRCDRAKPCGSCYTARTGDSCSYPSSGGPGTPSRTPRRSDDEGHCLGKVRRDSESSVRSTNDSTCNSMDASEFGPSSATDYSNAGQQHGASLLMDVANLSPVFEGGNFNVVPQSFGQGDQIDFRGSGFDWLDFDVSSIDLDLSRDPLLDTDAPAMPDAAAAVTNPPGIESATAPPTTQSRPNVLPWPFEQGQDAQAPRFPLPRLHQILPQPLPGTQPSAADSLMRLLSCQQLPHPNELINTDMSSGLELLRQLIDVYFSGFQIIQSIVHAPTWNVAECPTILLTAMACIGSALSGDSEVLELSGSLSDFCGSMITWLGVSDNSNYSDISYLAALCLHQIYSLGSGNRQLYQNADRTRGVLIGSLRGLGLLSSRLSLQQERADEHDPTMLDRHALHTEWTTWAARERERRIAWASFEYDCSLCTLTNRRGAVDLSELPSRLPCSDSLWEAQSANAWAALKSRSPSRSQGAMLSNVLSSTISGRPLTEHVSMWGKRLCAQIIGRLLWDLKQLETLSTPEYCGLPSLFKSHQQSKAALLQGLDSLLSLMTEPCSTSDLVSYNISSLLCHYSHMYAADDIMDIILFIVRNVVSKGPSSDERLEMARQRLTAAFKADSKRARRLLWHAGQIVAVANEYLVSAPCEIMRLFMAYIFILTFAKYSSCPADHYDGVRIRLDVTSHHADQRKAVTEWIQQGGPAQIGSAQDVLVKASTSSITRDAHAMFQRLHSWGLAEKFAKILQCFENNER